MLELLLLSVTKHKSSSIYCRSFYNQWKIAKIAGGKLQIVLRQRFLIGHRDTLVHQFKTASTLQAYKLGASI